MLATIQRHQADIRQTLGEAEAVLIKSGDLDLAGKGAIRSRLVAQLRTYTEFKHKTVFPVLLASPDRVVVHLAGQMKKRCDATADLYRRHLTDWPEARVADQRSLYRSAALDVIGRLRQHLVREQADVVRLTTERTHESAILR